jgi:hypothetical protein
MFEQLRFEQLNMRHAGRRQQQQEEAVGLLRAALVGRNSCAVGWLLFCNEAFVIAAARLQHVGAVGCWRWSEGRCWC